MVEIQISYPGELHCEAKHAPSATTLNTDAPLDNMGKGESFSPTDLLATSLGTCMATTMGILARRKGWNIDGLGLPREVLEKLYVRNAERVLGVRLPGP